LLTNLLLPAVPGVRLQEIAADDHSITLVMSMTSPNSACPLCHQPSHRIHSRYVRKLGDVPWSGVPINIRLRTRRFFCDQRDCRRHIFTERLAPAIAPYARRTRRLDALLESIGLVLGGEAGAPLANRLGMPTSPTTLLRILRRRPERSTPTPRVLGVDDWAWRRGHTYGTLLVDLERHQAIELLADRSANSLARWLEAHPGVEVICRDRAGLYAEGAERGAPTAIQVADRFHLLQNLRETLQRTLDHHPSELQQVRIQEAVQPVGGSTPSAPGALPSGTIEALPPAALSADLADVTSKQEPASAAGAPAPGQPATGSSAGEVTRLTASERSRQASRTRRERRYTEVHRLHAAGLGHRAIARQLHLNRKTVARFLKAEVFPERAQPPTKPSLLDRYVPYLREQLTTGHDNGLALWREIYEQGYRGSRSLVSRWVAHHRHLVPPARSEHALLQGRGSARALTYRPPTPLGTPLSARRAAWLLLSRPEDLAGPERIAVEQLGDICADVRMTHSLAQAFAQMARERRVDALDPWLVQATTNGGSEFKRFAEGLQRDYAAVRAALTLSYSSGQIEGQINKLKLLKRAMYGRAKFDLLRLRMLASDTS
jgi:transposase